MRCSWVASPERQCTDGQGRGRAGLHRRGREGGAGTAPARPRGDLRALGEPARVRRGLDFLGVATPQSQEKWVDDNIKEGAEREPKGVEFTIYDRSDGAPVGTAGLFQIAHARGRATFSIAIGERRGQGLGTEATRLVLDFAFHVLQLRNVMLEALAWNAAGLTAYERAGFRRIGVRRGAAISRGRPTDVVLMDAVPEDFGPSVLG